MCMLCQGSYSNKLQAIWGGKGSSHGRRRREEVGVCWEGRRGKFKKKKRGGGHKISTYVEGRENMENE